MTLFVLSALTNILRLIGALAGIPYQIFTMLQYILVILMGYSMKLYSIKSLDLYLVTSFTAYHLMRVLAEILHRFIKSDSVSDVMIIASTFTGLRIACISILFCKLLTYRPKLKDAVLSNKVIIIILSYTLLISILQNPFLFGVTWLQDIGGNITSGNHLGIFRSNGGLGGTVIMYANYLVITLYYIHFYNFGKVSYISVLIMFLVSSFLCFSRSVFLIMIFLLLCRRFLNIHALPYIIMSAVMAFSLVYHETVYEIINNIWITYDEMRGISDLDRQAGWIRSINHSSVFYHLLGSETGRNTGLLTGGMSKLNADGYILAHYYDFGLIGCVLLIAVILRSFLVSFDSLGTGYIYGVSFLILLFINSGFDKIFIVTYLYMVLIYIKNRAVVNAYT